MQDNGIVVRQRFSSPSATQPPAAAISKLLTCGCTSGADSAAIDEDHGVFCSGVGGWPTNKNTAVQPV